MRSYPIDSPEAVSRLLAVAMIIDGCLAPHELKTLHHSRVLELAGVSEDTFDETAGALAKDLMTRAIEREGVEIDVQQIDRLLEEVQDPALRELVLKGMLEIVQADRLVDHRERRLLQRATAAWAGPQCAFGA